METLIFVLQIISCIFLIGLILLQQGKGSDIGAAFGGASQTVFGSRGPSTFLTKLTIIVAIIFLAGSMYLAHAQKTTDAKSVVDKAEKIEQLEQGILEKQETKEEPAKEEKKEEVKKKDDANTGDKQPETSN